MPFDVVTQNLDVLAAGLALTILISLAAICCALLLGIGTAAARMSRARLLRILGGSYVELIRNTPMLTLLLLLYLALPEVGIHFSPVTALVLALSLQNGAYLSEIVRGGLQSVPKGQREAAAAIGLNGRTTFVEILAPQALRSIVPALINQFILTILASSLGTAVGVPELTQQVLFVDSRTYRTIELLIFLTLMYATLTFVVSQLGKAVTTRLDRAYLRK